MSKRSSALRCPSCLRNTFRMRSRLLDRFAPAGRSRSMSAGVVLMLAAQRAGAGGRRSAARRLDARPPCCLARAERLAASACGHGVGVLDRETAAGHGVEEIDLGAAKIANADRIHIQLDAVRFEHLVGVRARFFDHESVLESRAPAALHEDTEAAAFLV